MLCALSQFLDRNAHVLESASTLSLSDIDGDRPTGSSVDGIRNKDRCTDQSEGKHGGTSTDNPDEGRTARPRFKSKILALSAIRAHMVRSKSFPSSQHASRNNRTENDESFNCEDVTSEMQPSLSLEDINVGLGNNGDQCLSAQQQENKNRRHNRRHLPVPTGSHTVGCVDLMCDLADQGTFFRLYYPTNPTDIQRAYKQWPLWLPRKQYAHGYMYFLKKNRTIFGRLANWLGGDIYAPVLWQAPLLKSDEKFPVIIVSHGIGGNRTTLSTYSYELASRGFVVAAIEHRDGTASMTLCLTEQLETSIIDSDEADNKSNNNDCGTVNNNNDSQQQEPQHNCNQLPDSENQQRSQPGQEPVPSVLQGQRKMENVQDLEQQNQSCADSDHNLELNAAALTRDRPSVNSASNSDVPCSMRPPNKEKKECETDSHICDPSSLSQALTNEDKSENRPGDGGRGAWVRQRRENRRRSLRHNHSCSEEWRPFQHVEIWDDFDYRNRQMYQRADEISDLLDELISMNEGSHINNALGLAFTTNQFKNRLDFSRVAVIGHSFGGAAALATLVTDNRFKVGLCLDTWMHPVDSFVYNNTLQPALFLNMEQFQWEKNVNRMIRFQEAHPEVDRPMMTMIGGCHQSMTDFQFIVPQVLGRLIDVCHTLPPSQCMSTVMDASIAFLRKHLNLPLEPHDKDILECKHPHLMPGTNVDLTIPDDGPTPP
ncbi:platelet-activating factor acetylhydrolase [Plakobranchus ocellatus]|uniref:1-alkyl-2-acetylglycerophosphocholine esterase n=1 Tax=Plakobranchus ocellatus TaxID=259542 RepID=A0AAV3ZL44_9GAST|nr:platelet-activating factor acetylhydrolase [Plakobranchus ocellatus]